MLVFEVHTVQQTIPGNLEEGKPLSPVVMFPGSAGNYKFDCIIITFLSHASFIFYEIFLQF